MASYRPSRPRAPGVVTAVRAEDRPRRTILRPGKVLLIGHGSSAGSGDAVAVVALISGVGKLAPLVNPDVTATVQLAIARYRHRTDRADRGDLVS